MLDSPSIGRNLNLLSLGNVEEEQTLVKAGISLVRSPLDNPPEIPLENDFSSGMAARFGDLSVVLVASTKNEGNIFYLICDCMQFPNVDNDVSSSTGVVMYIYISIYTSVHLPPRRHSLFLRAYMYHCSSMWIAKFCTTSWHDSIFLNSYWCHYTVMLMSSTSCREYAKFANLPWHKLPNFHFVRRYQDLNMKKKISHAIYLYCSFRRTIHRVISFSVYLLLILLYLRTLYQQSSPHLTVEYQTADIELITHYTCSRLLLRVVR